jgi:hypothetical protein
VGTLDAGNICWVIKEGGREGSLGIQDWSNRLRTWNPDPKIGEDKLQLGEVILQLTEYS